MFNLSIPRRTALQQLGGLALAPLALPVAAAVERGQPVVWPEVKTLDGSTWGAKQAEGRAVVAVFWSVSCPFCRRHNEHVQKLHEAARGKALAVLGITRDKDEAAVRRYVAEKRYTFPVTMDAAPFEAQLASRRVIPLTVTIDRRGRLLQSYPGEMFEEDLLELLTLAEAR
jgi:peroxiredoxin